MFFGMCIYETLTPDGMLDSIIITPSSDSVLVADRLVDVGPKLKSDVDIGPLRFYTDGEGLSVRTAVSRLASFHKDGEEIRFRIEHRHWPLKPVHAGYYILLLPPGYGGYIDEPHRGFESVYMPDTGQTLLSATVLPDRPWIVVVGTLRLGAPPPRGSDAVDSETLFRRGLPGVYYSPVDNLLKAIRRDLTDAPSAFLCHSSDDKPEVRRLAINLAARGVRPWIDEAEIRVGDSLIGRIEEGIAESTCLVPVLSQNSVLSRWCREELRMALVKQINIGAKGVLPVRLDDCDIPGFLLDKKYADLRSWEKYEQEVDSLAQDIRVLS